MSNKPGEEEGGNGWMPISTAPKGIASLMWSAKLSRVHICDWAAYERHNQPQYTHWMPQPPAPGAAAAAPSQAQAVERASATIQAGLTDERILHLVDVYVGPPAPGYPLESTDWICFARAVEKDAAGQIEKLDAQNHALRRQVAELQREASTWNAALTALSAKWEKLRAGHPRLEVRFWTGRHWEPLYGSALDHRLDALEPAPLWSVALSPGAVPPSGGAHG